MKNFYNNKKVLITGHTGFKGSWLSQILINWESNVAGYSLNPPTNPSLFDLLNLNSKMISIIGDIRDFNRLKDTFDKFKPEIVIHMAAQPLVRESYENPVYTYETNVMGTVNICECVRQSDSVKSFLNVTTDKVYDNVEKSEGYTEDEKLDGYDPYSNSKSCSELVTHSYINSFLNELNIPTSTARAGNVIGGGDFARDRIIPDCFRACENYEDIIIRNPYSIRPFQHVLEPVVAYLMVAMEQWNDRDKCGSYNVGPADEDCWTTGKLADLFCKKWLDIIGHEIKWINKHDGGPHEAGFLKLNCAKIHDTFGWSPKWDMFTNMEKIIQWTKIYMEGSKSEVLACMNNQIDEYISL